MSSSIGSFRDLGVTQEEGNIGVVEIQRPPHNFFDVDLINAIADAYEALDEHPGCRAIVLCAEGKNFCAGANFQGGGGAARDTTASRARAEAATFTGTRSASSGRRPRWSPRCRERRSAAASGSRCRRTSGSRAPRAASARTSPAWGSIRGSVSPSPFRSSSAGNGPRSCSTPAGASRAMKRWSGGSRTRSPRSTGSVTRPASSRARSRHRPRSRSSPPARRCAGDLAERVARATDRELVEQTRLRATKDWQEGVKAMAERRPPNFVGA